MKAADIIKTGLKYVDPVLHALQLIQNITGLGGTDATTALKAVDAIAHAVEDGISKGVSPEEIIKELNKFTVGIAGNDTKHDAALADKFKAP